MRYTLIKKLLSIVLATILMLTFSVSALAQAEEISELYDYEKELLVLAQRGIVPIVEEESDVQYREINEELNLIGNIAKKTKATNHLNVYHYFQNGNNATNWKDIKMKTAGLTIGSAGCMITSFAMIARYYNGSAHTPLTINTKLGDAACPFVRTTAASKYGYTLTAYISGTQSQFQDNIIGRIMSEQPAMINMVKSNGSTHTVTAYGVNGSSVFIHDPESAWNYSLLETYQKNGWTIRSVYSYAN